MSLRTKFWGVLLGVAGLLACGCHADPNAVPIYQNAGDYAEALAEVKTLTKGPFEAMHEGYPISKEEMAGLKKADRMIDGLIIYNTQSYAPYILKGLTRRALGDKDGAMKAYLQGITFAPQKPTAADTGAIARIYDEIGTLYYDENQYANSEVYADQAVKLLPDDPSILSNTASTKIQLNKLDEARKLVTTALNKAPTYERALSLKKLLDGSTKKN